MTNATFHSIPTGRWITAVALATALAAPPVAFAGSTGTDELLASQELVPPTVIFVVDLSSDMSSPCDGSATGDSCLEDTLDAIDQVVRHFDWAEYGVVGTTSSPGDDDYYQVVPVGSSYSEISAALTALTALGAHSTTNRNLAEALEHVSSDYLSQTDADDDEDDDKDGNTGDWGETPIGYTCSDTYIIVLTTDRPSGDKDVGTAYGTATTTGTDVVCDDSGLSAMESECYYDNVVAHLYNTDHSSLTGTQRVIVNTIGINITSGSLAETLFDSAADQTSSAGVYTTAADGDEVLGAILEILDEIQSGVYSRSTPVITADGSYMILTFYEMTGDNPLAEGHIRAYELDDDSTSSTYGQVLYTGSSAYGGAVWDGGDLLVCRPVTASESQPDDRDGVGKRDIYTYEDAAYLLMLAEGVSEKRLGFDAEFATAVGASSATLDLYLDTTVSTSSPPCADNQAYDLDDDCMVDSDDMQALVDFTRGLSDAEYRYLDDTHGTWKLGDSPYSVPVVVTARDKNYSNETTYRTFLNLLESEAVPDIVLLAANDGMLHAFRLEDDASTSTEDEAGEELWAWIPGYLLLRDKDTEWANSLIDLVWYGKTFLFDGSPVVEDVWIDSDNDGEKDCGTDLDDCEWRRVVVVQQGLGGPVTLALDITYTNAPTFLWEQTNETDDTAMGYTMGRPVVFNIYDAEDSSSDPVDRYVAMWGGGRAVGYTGSTGNAYYRSGEANLYMWAVSDDVWSGGADSVGYSDAGDNIEDEHPDLVSNGGDTKKNELDYDSDDPYEHTYISAALAAVDVDSDGDGDVLYFPVTTAYRPVDESGAGYATPKDPGSSWMFKAILDTEDPDDLEWCEFYDPLDGTDGTNGIGSRPEVFYAATTAWLTSGYLAVYWGTGTPFDRDGSDEGYFFAMYDESPTSCSSKAKPLECDGETGGFYELDAGEGLTGDPLVYAGVVYFATYVPDSDRCEVGTGRVYGLRYEDCSPGLDTDGDGEATSADTAYVETTGIVNVAVGNGVVYYAGSNPTVDGTTSVVETFDSVTDPFLGTTTMAWMEMY